MALDPILVEDTRNWLLKAAEDLEVASILMRHVPPLLSAAAFHCQQTAEKAFKAFLTWHDEPFRKMHDLKKIGGACTRIDRGLAEITKQVAPISDWAVDTRYPDEMISPTEQQVIDALNLVRELFQEILSRLPAETHP
jgi:HEPN domain-containing protein